MSPEQLSQYVELIHRELIGQGEHGARPVGEWKPEGHSSLQKSLPDDPAEYVEVFGGHSLQFVASSSKE